MCYEDMNKSGGFNTQLDNHEASRQKNSELRYASKWRKFAVQNVSVLVIMLNSNIALELEVSSGCNWKIVLNTVHQDTYTVYF
jgi:hypothetical protein